MKTTKQQVINLSIILLIILQSVNSYGQFLATVAPGGVACETAIPNEAVSVGNSGLPFGPAALNAIRARLHVNSFYMPPSTAPTPVSPGQVFRTDAIDNVDNTWELWSGPTATSTTPKFSITVPASSPTDVNIFTLQPGGNMLFGTGGSQTMILTDGTNPAFSGFLGIGFGFITPLHRLDVRSGDINCGNGTAASSEAYMIGDSAVLWHRSFVSDIFVGVKAGINTVGLFNTFVGNQSGEFNYPGARNTFVGYQTGKHNAGGNDNTFVGYKAGIDNTAIDNTFVGSQAGFANAGSTGNTYVGFQAGFSSSAHYNTMVGWQAGRDNVAGQNVMVGYRSGVNTNDPNAHFNTFLGANSGTGNNTGRENVCIGYTADVGATGLTNAISIGRNAVVMNNNEMILGDNLVDVGIGLSSVATGPQAKLDVKQTTAATRGIQVTHTGNSSAGLSAVGIKSLMRGNGVGNCRTIAAWLESRELALVVPKSGGQISIGFAQDFLSTGGNDCWTPMNAGFLVEINGTVCSGGAVVCPSDVSMKTNVNPITNALDKVSRLNGVSFEWLPAFIGDSAMTGTHLGFIAQQVDTVLPEVVCGDCAPGRMGIAYTEVIPVLTEAIKELKAWKDSVQNASARTANSNTPSQSATLASEAILYQNTPNPFGDATSIAYYLPDQVVKAQIVFFDIYGKEIKTIELANRGDAKVDLTTSDLASGIYTYRLIADGAIVKTLQMVRAK